MEESDTSPRHTLQLRPREESADQNRYDVPSDHASRYVDPSDLVRQRAVERAENRRMRIEARKWLGYDPLRPAVNAMPYTSSSNIRPALVVIPFVVADER